ncbi:MAG: glycosylase, partial [Defluviitaleaceae bacterium]|nr:glycosylase [Defluviitaleaceae bacterium]
QEGDPGSIMNTVKSLISLRRRYGDLNADGSFEVVHAKAGDPLFAYRRGSLLLFANPAAKEAGMSWRDTGSLGDAVYSIGGTPSAGNGRISLPPQSFAVMEETAR